MSVRILIGDARASLRTLEADSVHTCVTSPPYWGLRDYGHDGQIGLERTPAEYVAQLVEVFSEVRRVLRDDGTLWLNLGDTYARESGVRTSGDGGPNLRGTSQFVRDANHQARRPPDGLKPKDLVGIPWRVAFALQDDGWYLRSDIIWSKPNPMPESVTDRPTKAHEYLFLLSKSEWYAYDAAAVREPDAGGAAGNGFAGRHGGSARVGPQDGGTGTAKAWTPGGGRNRRTVWTIPTHPFHGAHFATMPPALVEPCVLAGSPVGGTVLDPFGGAGTVGLVARRLQRRAVLCELNPAYAEMARRRIEYDAPLLNGAT